MEPRIGSAVLVFHDSHILLGRCGKEPGYGQWVVPGGKIEFGETINQAGEREIKEETGLDVRIYDRLGVYELIDKDQHRIIIFSRAGIENPTWRNDIPASAIPIKASSDLLEAKFFDKEGLAKLKPELSKFTKRILLDAGLLDWSFEELCEGVLGFMKSIGGSA